MDNQEPSEIVAIDKSIEDKNPTVNSDIKSDVKNEAKGSVNDEVVSVVQSEVANEVENEVVNGVKNEVVDNVNGDDTDTVNKEVIDNDDEKETKRVDNKVTDSVDKETDAEVTESSTEKVDTEVIKVVDTEVTKTETTKETKSVDKEVTKTEEIEVTQTEGKEVTKPEENEVTQSAEKDVTKTDNIKVTKVEDNEVTKSAEKEVTETEKIEETKILATEVKKSEDTEVTTTIDKEATKSVAKEVETNSEENEVTTVVENEVIKKESDIVDSKITKIEEVEVSKSVDIEVTKSVTEISKTVDTAKSVANEKNSELINIDLSSDAKSEAESDTKSETPSDVTHEVAEIDESESNNSEEAFHLRIGYLHPDTIELAKSDLRETPEVRAAAIVELRKLLHASPDIKYKDDDKFLLIFLRVCHFYPNSSFEKMKSIATFRKEHANLVHGLHIAQLKEKFINGNIVRVLKNCDQKGRRVMIVNCGEVWNPSEIPADDVFRMLYMVHLAAQLEPETQVRGVVCIMDFEGLSMKQVRALSPSFSRRLLTFIQDAMPLRTREIHYVKQPFIFKMVWSLFKPFVKEKLNKRMHFHGSDMKSLHKFLSPDILPANYKGNLPKIDYGGKEWWPALEKHGDFVDSWGELGPTKW